MSGDTPDSPVETKRRELAKLKAQAAELEGQLHEQTPVAPFQPPTYYTAYYATAGFFLGMIGAFASLIFNVVGSLVVGQDALQLIRVYLTFPLGDSALQFTAEENGLVLAIGCCLYIATGMVFGVPFFVILARFADNAAFIPRLILGTVISIALWLINFYAILFWLQPALIDMSRENLIVNQVPPWVAALTHLVYGWSMVLLYPLGKYVPYQRVTEQSR